MTNKKFLGLQYPLVKTSRGIFAQKSDVDQIKADMIQLLLTNPGERCLVGDTAIPLANGTDVLIKDLVGKDPFWVYSYDKERDMIVPGKATARKTLENAELIEITLDNNEKVRCTPDHLWLLRDGSYCRADSLLSGISLMPLHRNLNTSKYERIYQPYLGDYRETHLNFVFDKRLVGIREVVHHKDLNKRNNAPDNLQWMTCKNHKELHRIIRNAFQYKLDNDPGFKQEWLEKLTNGVRNYYATHENPSKGKKRSDEAKQNIAKQKNEHYASEAGKLTKQKISEAALKQFATQGHPSKGRKLSEEEKENLRGPRPSMIGDNNPSKRPDVREKLKEAWVKRREKKHLNHKVLSVVKLTHREDCYDLHVEEYHNFAVSAGAFVHNCMLPTFGTPLRELIFEPNDTILEAKARQMIANSLAMWEPRVDIQAVEVSSRTDKTSLNILDPGDDIEHILSIKIMFIDPVRITEVQELRLEIPLAGD